MIQKFIRSNFSKQVMGAGLGMLGATALYFLLSQLPSSQITSANLARTVTPGTTTSSVRVNDTGIDPTALKRIVSKAQQVASARAAAPIASSSSSSVNPDANAAWLAMRAARQELAAKMEVKLSSSSVAVVVAVVSSSSSASSLKTMPVVNYPVKETETPTPVTHSQTEQAAALPNSGLGLNLTILVSLFLAFALVSPERKRALIAMLH